jgi:cell division protein FtsB
MFMQLNAYKQWIRLTALCGALGFGCAYTLFHQHGYVTYCKLQQAAAKEKLLIDKRQTEIKHFKNKIAAWNKNPYEHEKAIRTTLGYAQPNQMVYILPQQK